VKLQGAKNIKAYGQETITIKNPSSLPDRQIIEEMYEPFVIGTIITPGTFKTKFSICSMQYPVAVKIRDAN
jgi:translation elongation factor EF-4